ncbi:MAG: glycosyltransferase family 2 protein [Lachnospiraceae bacterium]|nr:glycosyltransferase family 2 protein [Lachnospiraceae bacterium]
MQHLLTVFTPTYNRRDLLKRVYESLKAQTSKDFVWLVCDDGSDDGTSELIEGFISEGILDIRYEYFNNGGKMRAHNKGVMLCDTELFVCLDSDDYLVKDAVKRITDCYEGLDEKDPLSEKQICGIVAHKGESEDKVLYGQEFPDVLYSTLYGLYLKGFKGETTLVYKTEVLRQFPFPETEGEKYVPEDYIYDKIDGEYVLKVLPEIITVCEIVSSGYTDSLKRLKRDNPEAWYLYYRQRTEITPHGILKFKYSGYYVIYALRTSHKLIPKDSGSDYRKDPKTVRSENKIGAFTVLSGLLSALLIIILRKQ